MKKNVYKVNTEKILFSQLGDEGVLFDLEKNEYKTLNETMYKIFEKIMEGSSIEEITDSLIQEYNITKEECREKVEKAITVLTEKNYIKQV